MRASSLSALARVREELARQCASAGDIDGIAHGLFALGDLLVDQPRLADALTDPGRSAEDRAALAERVLGRVRPEVRDIARNLASQRWSEVADMARAANRLGALALGWHAQSEGAIPHVLDDLFAVEETLREQRELRIALSDRKRLTPEQRAGLARKVFGPHVGSDALALIERAVGAHEQRPVIARLADYRADLANIDEKQVVTVRTATPLSHAQVNRLHDILARRLSTDVVINVALDPDLIGGMRVNVGDTIFDGSLAAALRQAERRIAGASAS